MELDLNLFLHSSTDSSDSDTNHNRTIDDILNDSDSSSASPSSSPRSSPSIHRHITPPHDPVPIVNNPVPIVKTETSRPGSIRDFSSLNRRALFGSVRSNAKPGAALAAATAASRSVPTPHAAAIKSRRAAGIARLRKNLEEEEVMSSSSDSVRNSAIGSDSKELDEKLSEEDDKFDEFQSATLDKRAENGGVLEADVLSESLREDNLEFMPSLANFESEATDFQLDDKSTISPSISEEHDNVVENVREIESIEEKVPSSPRLDDAEIMEEEQEVSLANVIEDDTNLKNDVDELVEDMIAQIESKLEIKNTEKKSKPLPKKPLELAEELEKKNAYTGLHMEEGAAAQPMRLEGVRRGSIALGYFDIDSNNTITRIISSQAFKRDHGSSQVLAVHLNYIAVGMSKGVIVVVPSKYSPHNVDNMDAKMLMLGLQGDKSHAPVTSMCFNQLGDLLLAGYGDGHITIWDVLRAAAAKVITGEHIAPVVHTFFLGQDSQVTRQFKAVTGDSKGLVLLHTFSESVVPLLNRFSIKTQCLLDGQRTGTVLAASPLLLDAVLSGALMSSSGNASASTGSIRSMMGGVVGGDGSWKLFTESSTLVEEGVVVFVTHQTALVLRLTPKLEVYAQFSKPDGVREGSMPCTAWKCTSQSHSSSPTTENMPAETAEKISLLAIAWDRKVQVAKLINSKLKVYGKWTLDSAAVGVAWLDDQMLVVLTLTGQLCLFGKDGTVIHQTSFTLDGTGGDDLIAYHTNFTNIYGNPEKAYNNSVATRGATVYILGPAHLIVSRLLPWKERILVLRKAGDWMGAMNMSMTFYDGHAHGVIDLPRSLDDLQETIMPYLVELLQSYVDEVFSYISVAFGNQIEKMEHPEDLNDKSASANFKIKEQFTRVGGVAVEFCVHIKRTDILFDEIFSKFVSVQHRDTFLELLEPYILRDMLGSLPPEIMQALVEHYSSKGWLQRVEQCVLHMDISSLDFNQIVRLCREHGLYGALIYLFNRGLDDYRAPIEELLIVLQKSQRESATVLGYRMLVYLKYCFSGLAFPPGHGDISPSRLPSLRVQLMQFLLEDSNAPSKGVKKESTMRTQPNLIHLLELDTEASLDVLRCAFIEDDILKHISLEHDLDDANMEAKKENDSMSENKKMLVQRTIDALVNILDMDILPTDKYAESDNISSRELWPSKNDTFYLFDFIAHYVACQSARVSKNVLNHILEYLISDNNETSKGREKQVLAILKVVPETDWNETYVLELCEKVHFHQVCGLIHTRRRQHLDALDSYMKDVGEPIHAFSFINNTLSQLLDTESATFRSAIISRIPELFNLNREGTLFLLIDHFNKESSHIISELRSHPESLFLYLKTVIEVHLSGTLNFSSLLKYDTVDFHCGQIQNDQSNGSEAYLKRIADFPKYLRNNPILVTDDMVELYFELLCQYERNSALNFLEIFESYRVEHCLRLCQKYGIIDAAAFLFERVGDATSALSLTLSGINEKFSILDVAVVKVLAKDGSIEIDTVLKMIEVNSISDILHACIGLCQRNTPRLDPEESESLWFRLLDSFCEPLIDSDDSQMVNDEQNNVRTLAKSFNIHNEDGDALNVMWRISKSHGGAKILRKLFSRFIKKIVEGMIGYVRLPTIMLKLLSDNGSQEFGDFKLTILGMLNTYGFERRILGTAKSLIEDDTFYSLNLLKRGASHGYAPRSSTCCICNSALTKNSSSSGLRVFSCGHALHLQCELVEHEASKRGSGCPICMPRKKIQKPKNRSFITENGLFSKSLSKRSLAPGNTVLHPYENDPFENPYGLQQISRFEILASLRKDQGLIQLENMPKLKLAPPVVYHEKVKKGTDFLTGESSSGLAKIEKPSKNKKFRDLKAKGSSLRFPLKSSIFGKEKISRQ